MGLGSGSVPPPLPQYMPPEERKCAKKGQSPSKASLEEDRQAQ